MPAVDKNHPGRRLPLSYRMCSLVAVLLLLLVAASTFFALSRASKAARASTVSSFGFSVTGDYDQTTRTTNNLHALGQLYSGGQIGFGLGLGDFSYVNNPTATQAAAWSTYAKGNLPSGFPFEIVAGRHDVTAMGAYASDLPDRIGDVVATCPDNECAYGQQYYFDYPSPAAPLARFIMISPNQSIANYSYNYDKGGADYNWVQSAIEAARLAGIPWVIVGMHQYCFAIGYASCKDQQLLDMLLNEHVDVILQAQKHNYQRSKQLALNATTCPTLNATSYNANCVANATNGLSQGKGTVIVLTGTGGASLLSIPSPSTDPKTGYFANWQSSAWGFSQFTISATQLTEQYDAVPAGAFQDGFTIQATPPPPPPPPGTTVAQDNFQRNDQTRWGLATDGTNTWGADASTRSNFAIVSHTGQVSGSVSGGTSYNATLGPGETNAEVVASATLSAFGTYSWGAVLRWADGNDFYKAALNGSNLAISKKVGGKVTILKSVSFKATAGTSYTVDFSVVGSTLVASAWPTSGGSAPGSPLVTAADATLSSSGSCGVIAYLASGVNANFTAFEAIAH